MLAHRVIMGVTKGKAPNELSTAVFRWYDAGQITGLSDGDPVSQWDDESANADHAVQTTGASQPIYKTGIINGHPVVRFDGSNDRMRLSKILDTSGAVGHIFVVVKGNGKAGILSTRSGTTTGWSLRFNSTTDLLYYHSDETPNISYSIADQFNIIEVRRNGLDVQIGANGTLGATSTISGYTASAASNTFIGYESSGSSEYLNGDIAENVIYASLLSSADRLDLISHFKAKYGIS